MNAQLAQGADVASHCQAQSAENEMARRGGLQSGGTITGSNGGGSMAGEAKERIYCVIVLQWPMERKSHPGGPFFARKPPLNEQFPDHLSLEVLCIPRGEDSAAMPQGAAVLAGNMNEKIRVSVLKTRYMVAKANSRSGRVTDDYLGKDLEKLGKDIREYMENDLDEDIGEITKGAREIGDSALKVIEEVVRGIRKNKQ